MSEQRKTTQLGASRSKKPYSKPGVRSEPIYETGALACGKVTGQSAACNGAPKVS